MAGALTITPALLRSSPLPDADGGKEGRGRTLVVGGSAETPGGARLAAEATLRCGAGKLQVATAASVAAALAVALPEAMVRGLPETGTGAISAAGAERLRELGEGADCVLIGPGLADIQESAKLAAAIVRDLDAPVVLDALALAAVTADVNCVRHLTGRVVLTPNPDELAQCLGEDQGWVAESPDRAASRLAADTGAVVSVGGEVVWTAAPDGRTWRDDGGSQGLGVSGAGDVRAGPGGRAACPRRRRRHRRPLGWAPARAGRRAPHRATRTPRFPGSRTSPRDPRVACRARSLRPRQVRATGRGCRCSIHLCSGTADSLEQTGRRAHVIDPTAETGSTMTMPALLRVRTATIRVLSVPTDHVYVHHLAPAPGDPPVQPEVLRLRDPQDPWWPPPALDPRWLAQRIADFDLLHLHFGFDARSVDDLRAVVDVLRAAGKPLVQTVHDLRNPHHLDRRTHDEHLDVLIPAADALVTLTPGAAEEIRRRWGRTALVVPHPHVVPLGEMRRRRDLRAAHGSGFTVGLHLKSMRPCMSGPPVIEALMQAVAEIDEAVLRIDVHRDVAEPGGDRYDRDLMHSVGAARARGARVDVHDFYSDEELWDYLQSIDVSVLPYRYGTHSGWLEACRDLGTAVAAPDCGYYADQGPVHTFHLDEDGLDVASVPNAIAAAHAAGRPEPLAPASRAAQRRRVAAAHAQMYRELVR